MSAGVEETRIFILGGPGLPRERDDVDLMAGGSNCGGSGSISKGGLGGGGGTASASASSSSGNIFWGCADAVRSKGCPWSEAKTLSSWKMGIKDYDTSYMANNL